MTIPARCRDILTLRVEFARRSGKRFQIKYAKMTAIAVVSSRGRPGKSPHYPVQVHELVTVYKNSQHQHDGNDS